MVAPETSDIEKTAQVDPLVDAVAWDILEALHSNVPEADRPMSWSDMDQDQEARIRAAAVAAIERIQTDRVSLAHTAQLPLADYDPTAFGDEVASRVRSWYEANRESWWDRHRAGADRRGIHADEFMLALVQQVAKAERERALEIRTSRAKATER